MKTLPIPKNEQLEALAMGLASTYKLLSSYLGDLNQYPNFWKHITITKKELADFLRKNQTLAYQHVHKDGDPKYHESPILEACGRSYRVYEMDHTNPRDIRKFDDIADAAAAYLLWGIK